MIGPQKPNEDSKRKLNSAHVCPQCGFRINIAEIGLRESTTGIVTCPKCDWSGQIVIQIVENNPAI
jgi:ribosomal protein L37AE/L43A